MITLGITFSHDGTLTIVRDGRHEYSIGEERLNRTKAYIGFPFKALREAISKGRIDPNEVDAIAIPLARYPRKAAETFAFTLTENKRYYDLQNEQKPPDFFLEEDAWRRVRSDADCREYVRRQLSELLAASGIIAPIRFVDHHLAHAASAYYSSGLERALAITMDGEGDGLSATVNICEGGKIRRVSSTDRFHSAGSLYSAVTKKCGFKMSRHEGKITGLAAFGDPARARDCFMHEVRVVDGKLHYPNLRGHRLHEKVFLRLGQMIGVNRSSGMFQVIERCGPLSDKDLAAAVQDVLEVRISEIVTYWMDKTGIHDVVLAGGVFANVKFNQRIGELKPLDSLYIFPDMGDGGTAYGAAMLHHNKHHLYDHDLQKLKEVYLGPEFTNSEIEEALRQYSNINYCRSEDVCLEAAQLLADNKIVGWFQGRMEYGPRSLGNRSVLASPQDANINNWLNQRMKRTEFMPFAPSCLYEYADEVFNIPNPSLKRAAEFMTITFPMRPEWALRAPAVAHIDQTARPQLVKRDVNPRYHQLLTEYHRMTGLPLCINTSFNVHEEPIVCQPDEAIRSLCTGVIDVLVIGDFIARLRK